MPYSNELSINTPSFFNFEPLNLFETHLSEIRRGIGVRGGTLKDLDEEQSETPLSTCEPSAYRGNLSDRLRICENRLITVRFRL